MVRRLWSIPCGWIDGKTRGKELLEIDEIVGWLLKIHDARRHLLHEGQHFLDLSRWNHVAKGMWVKACRAFWAKVVKWTHLILSSLLQQPWTPHEDGYAIRWKEPGSLSQRRESYKESHQESHPTKNTYTELCLYAKSLQSCPTPCDPMDCSPPGSMGFSRWKYWSGLPCPPQGDFPDPGIEPESGMSYIGPTLVGGFFTTITTWEAHTELCMSKKVICVCV